MNLDDFIIEESFPADRGHTPNWQHNHPWLQCFGDWTEHTKVWMVYLPEEKHYGGLQLGHGWKILADSAYQAQQAALELWKRLPYEQRYQDEVDD
jgi:hypothetical protein